MARVRLTVMPHMTAGIYLCPRTNFLFFMSINIKACERNISFSGTEKKYAYVMRAQCYNRLSQEKVMAQAALNSGMSKSAIRNAATAIAAVVSDWATEGHSVDIPYLGTMRFGLRSQSASTADDVSSSLILSRRVIFTPSTDIKDALSETSVSIECYDRNGTLVKRTRSNDDGTVDTDDADTSGGTTTGGSSTSDSGDGGFQG